MCWQHVIVIWLFLRFVLIGYDALFWNNVLIVGFSNSCTVGFVHLLQLWTHSWNLTSLGICSLFVRLVIACCVLYVSWDFQQAAFHFCSSFLPSHCIASPNHRVLVADSFSHRKPSCFRFCAQTIFLSCCVDYDVVLDHVRQHRSRHGWSTMLFYGCLSADSIVSTTSTSERIIDPWSKAGGDAARKGRLQREHRNRKNDEKCS